MHYVRLHKIETKLFDGQITDPEEKKSILKTAQEQNYDCEIIFSDGLKYKLVRIKNVVDQDVTIQAIVSKHNFINKTLPIKTIETFVIRTEGEEIVRKQDKVSRFTILDTIDDLPNIDDL